MQTLKIPVEQALQLAAQQIDEGQLPKAEAILRQILQPQPTHAAGLHLMGVLAHKAGKARLAVEFIGKAIEIQPNVAQFHSNRGEMCRMLNRLNEAIHHGEQGSSNPIFRVSCNQRARLRDDSIALPQTGHITCYRTGHFICSLHSGKYHSTSKYGLDRLLRHQFTSYIRSRLWPKNPGRQSPPPTS